jgi:hypothetical protein
MADIAIAHGFLVLLTGLMIMVAKSKVKRSIRAVHITLGILTSVYGLLTYLVTP